MRTARDIMVLIAVICTSVWKHFCYMRSLIIERVSVSHLTVVGSTIDDEQCVSISSCIRVIGIQVRLLPLSIDELADAVDNWLSPNPPNNSQLCYAYLFTDCINVIVPICVNNCRNCWIIVSNSTNVWTYTINIEIIVYFSRQLYHRAM